MRRRSVLAGVGISLTSAVAGCLDNGATPEGRGDDEPNADDNGSEDPTNGGTDTDGEDEEPSGFQRSVSVTAVDETPASVPIEFGVGVIKETISADGTAIMEMAVTNAGETERQVHTPYYKGWPDDRGILLYSLEAPDSPPRDDTPECIDDPSPSQEYVEMTEEGPLVITVEPGETGTDELILVDDPTIEGCVPPGEYRFESRHSIDDTEFTWGFTVEVADESRQDIGDRRYETCHREIIPYERFPDEVQSEIDAALGEGERYEGERVYLREAMDVERSYVSVDDTYYEATVTVEADRETLALAAVEPKALPRPRPVTVTHRRSGERTLSLELIAEDGTTLIEDALTIGSGEADEIGRVTRVGTHDLRVTVLDGETVEDEMTESVTIDESRIDIIVFAESDEITVGGEVADIDSCQYET